MNEPLSSPALQDSPENTVLVTTTPPDVPAIFRENDASAALPFPSGLEAVELLGSRWRLVAGSAFGLGLFALGVAFLVPNTYEATARLMPPSSPLASTMAMAGSDDSGGGASSLMGAVGGAASALLGLNSQSDFVAGVLQGDHINNAIVQRFDLMHRYNVWSGYREDCLKKLGKNTDFDVDHKSNIISVAVRDEDPQTAVRIANAYVDELNRLLIETNTSSAHKERVFLEDRLKETKGDLDAAAKEFGDFSSQHTTLEISDQAKAMVEGAAAIQGQLIAAEAQLRSLQAQYTDQNYRVVQARATVDELRQQLVRLGGREVPGKGIESYDGMFPSIRQLPVLGVEYMNRFRRLKVDEAVFTMLTKQLEAAKILEAQTVPTVEVLDPPLLPQKKASPHRGLIAIGAFLFGLIASIGWVIGSFTWDAMRDDDARKSTLRRIAASFRRKNTAVEWERA